MFTYKMFTYKIINLYCDYMISSFQYIKSLINLKSESLEDYILSLSNSDLLIYIENSKYSQIVLCPTCSQRYFFYKKLKGKTSFFDVYSYGQENNDTRKNLVIKKIN